MQLSVTTPRGALVDTEVDEVTAPGALGEFGVLPGHVPFLSALKPGRVRLPPEVRQPRAGGRRRHPGGGPRRAAATRSWCWSSERRQRRGDRPRRRRPGAGRRRRRARQVEEGPGRRIQGPARAGRAWAAARVGRRRRRRPAYSARTEAFFVTCAKGTEGPLRRELADLRIRGPKGDGRRRVASRGRSTDGHEGLPVVARGHARAAGGGRVPGAQTPTSCTPAPAPSTGRAHLDTRATLAVSATVRDNPALAHTGLRRPEDQGRRRRCPAGQAGRPPRRRTPRIPTSRWSCTSGRRRPACTWTWPASRCTAAATAWP